MPARHATIVLWILATLALVGCPGDSSDDDDIAVVDDDTTPLDCVETMQAMLQEVSPAPEISLDWSAFTEDAGGNSVDPAALDSMSVLGFQVGTDATIEGLCDGSLHQADVSLYWIDDDIAGSTSAGLDTSEMADTTLVVSVSSATGISSAALATVVEGSPNTTIHIESGGEVPPG